MAVDDQYEFTAHECSKDGTEWVYCCKYRLTPKVKCPGRVRVTQLDNRWILKSVDYHHRCEPNKARVTAELLRHRMKNIVRKNPVQAVGKAIRIVRIEAAEEFGEDDYFYLHLVAELGTDSAAIIES
jgi:hypothetical protein